jgi:hypothetical protein
MTVKFEYKCDKCEFDYVEQRGKDEPQIFAKCHSCREGDLIETNQIVLADHVERQPGVESEAEVIPVEVETPSE